MNLNKTTVKIPNCVLSSITFDSVLQARILMCLLTIRKENEHEIEIEIRDLFRLINKTDGGKNRELLEKYVPLIIKGVQASFTYNYLDSAVSTIRGNNEVIQAMEDSDLIISNIEESIKSYLEMSKEFKEKYSMVIYNVFQSAKIEKNKVCFKFNKEFIAILDQNKITGNFSIIELDEFVKLKKIFGCKLYLFIRSLMGTKSEYNYTWHLKGTKGLNYVCGTMIQNPDGSEKYISFADQKSKYILPAVNDINEHTRMRISETRFEGNDMSFSIMQKPAHENKWYRGIELFDDLKPIDAEVLAAELIAATRHLLVSQFFNNHLGFEDYILIRLARNVTIPNLIEYSKKENIINKKNYYISLCYSIDDIDYKINLTEKLLKESANITQYIDNLFQKSK
ncbi:MAG: replication initiation protein [Anaeroplasma sp.]|nr:replication initiation protein [Anaeroplasma sp.]